ncbi:hypothetical protein L1987_03742 [Smallanthus sonchifolius]|uniref:Uncharacterized protein n=1 Tax=Smallanthus sonchifolius TaxID=185202 RepID=A0ACB9KBN3_9ASTR|nr:hypothetical protein L1987_03742 [Smallanthus sonchifolius]
MSVSAIFGAAISPVPALRQSPYAGSTVIAPPVVRCGDGIGTGIGGLVIECSSRPQKKATAHHRKSRPKKTQPWDRNRGPTVYPPLPALPPEWSFVTEEAPPSSPTPSQ